MKNIDIVYKKLKDLEPYKNNPRQNDSSIRAVANSIQEFGFKVPIVIDKNNIIVAGHTRYKASKLLGLDEVPCIVADDLTEEQINAFRIADNSTSSMSEWDLDLLSLELKDISFNMEEFGLYLDNGDIKDKKSEIEKEKEIEKMELRSFESYDYLVFVFDNIHDFVRMAEEFGLHKVDAGWVNRKIGLGRVIKGAELIKRLGH